MVLIDSLPLIQYAGASGLGSASVSDFDFLVSQIGAISSTPPEGLGLGSHSSGAVSSITWEIDWFNAESDLLEVSDSDVNGGDFLSPGDSWRESSQDPSAVMGIAPDYTVAPCDLQTPPEEHAQPSPPSTTNHTKHKKKPTMDYFPFIEQVPNPVSELLIPQHPDLVSPYAQYTQYITAETPQSVEAEMKRGAKRRSSEAVSAPQPTPKKSKKQKLRPAALDLVGCKSKKRKHEDVEEVQGQEKVVVVVKKSKMDDVDDELPVMHDSFRNDFDFTYALSYSHSDFSHYTDIEEPQLLLSPVRIYGQ